MSTKTSKKTKNVTPVEPAPAVDAPATSGGSSTPASLLASSSSSAETVNTLAASASFAPLVPVGITAADILTALQSATPEQLSALREFLGPVVAVKKEPKAKAAPKPKKEKSVPAPPPVPEDGSVPTAASYRMLSSDIDHSTCLARVMKDGVDDDKRWKPAVYREHQCGKDVASGSDLCSGCIGRQDKAAATGKHGHWNGRVTEDPPSWCHMLGTAWSAKCKWNPDGASESASVASSHSSTTEKMDAKKEAAAAKKEAAAAKKAEAATKKAAKDAEKAAKAAAPKKSKKAAAASVPAVPSSSSNAAADTSAPVATVAGEVEIIGHSMYWVRNGNVYEYDEETNKEGAYVGRKSEDGSIDEDAEEEVEEESDSE
jgi:hypothetical protein